MFNERLHRELDSESEREFCVRVLESFDRELKETIELHGWSEQDGLRHILAAGIRAIAGWREAPKPLDQMSKDELLEFLQNRASSLDAAYATMKFQAYQVMNQHDALEMNLKGLMPRLEAATERVQALEDEVRRLRDLVPEEQRRGTVLVREPENEEPEEEASLGDRVRRFFGGDG